MPDVNTIQELLKQARATLDAGDLDQAEKLYRQAMDDAAPLDLDVFDAALDGVQEVKRRRQESSPAPKSAPKRPASGPLPPLPAPPPPDPIIETNHRSPESVIIPPLEPSASTVTMLTVEAMSPMSSVEPDAPPAPSVERRAELQQRIRELEAQANHYLAIPTNESLKAARNLFDQLSAFDELTNEQRAHYRQRRDQVATQRIEQNQWFNDLITARQLGLELEQLIVIRKLRDEGVDTDHVGRDLDEDFADVRNRLVARLIKSAQEQIASGKASRSEGVEYLEAGLVQLAEDKVSEVLRILDGQTLESHSYPRSDPAHGAAFAYIEGDLQQNGQLQEQKAAYEPLLTDIQRLKDKVSRARPLYDQATTASQQQDYATAIKKAREAQALLGADNESAQITRLLQQVQAAQERARMEQAASPAPSPSDSTPIVQTPTNDQSEPESSPLPVAMEPIRSSRDAVQQRIQELEEQAKRHLEAPTNENLKAARNLFEQISSFDELPVDQRTHYRQRRDQVETQRIEQSQVMGELFTARQLGKELDHLIAIRKLRDSGVTTDYVGKDLDEDFADVRNRLVARLIKSAQEQIAIGKASCSEGVEYLEVGLVQLAEDKVSEAFRILDGQTLESPDYPRNQNLAAFTYIEGDLQQNGQLQEQKAAYEPLLADIRRLKNNLNRARPLYDRAYDAYEQSDYENAIKKACEAQAILGADNESAQITRLLRFAKEYAEQKQKITERIVKRFSEAEAALADDSIETVMQARQQVEEQRSLLLTIADVNIQSQLRVRLDELASRLEMRRDELETDYQARAEVEALLVQAHSEQIAKRYSEARDYVEQARKQLDKLGDKSELRKQCDGLASTIRSEWGGSLRNEIRIAMRRNAENPQSALERLKELRTIDKLDVEMERFEQQAQEAVARANGLEAHTRGDYITAITELSKVRASDSEVLTKLHEARRRIGEQHIAAAKWQEAVAMLEQADQDNPETSTLLNQARLGRALTQAATARRDNQLEEAGRQLAYAEQLSTPPFAAQVQAERQRLDTALAAAQKGTNAVNLYSSFEQTGNLDQLQAALRNLTDAIEMLPAGERQREALEQRRYGYTDKARFACLDAIPRAQQHLTNNEYQEALHLLRQAEALDVLDQKQSLQDALTNVRRKILARRNEITNRVQELLKNRYVTGKRISALLTEVRVARTWDDLNDDGLHEAEHNLTTATTIIARVEEQLDVVLRAWAIARRQSSDFDRAIRLITEAVRITEREPYKHALLNEGGNESLARRINEDKQHYEEAQKLAGELTVAFDQPNNLDIGQIRPKFERLHQMEDLLLHETQRIVEALPTEPRPATNAERYPRQYRLLAHLRDSINQTVRRLRDDPAAGIAELRQYRALRAVFDALNRENRFDLAQQIETL